MRSKPRRIAPITYEPASDKAFAHANSITSPLLSALRKAKSTYATPLAYKL